MSENRCAVLDLPREVVVHIFSYYVKSEGIMHLLRDIAMVCEAWNEAATDFTLYRTVDDPNLPLNKLLSLGKKGALLKTEHLNVSHLKHKITFKDLLILLPECPKLKELNICTKEFMHSKFIRLVPEFCQHLENFTLSNGNITMTALVPLFTICGSNLKCLNLSGSHFSNFCGAMTQIAQSCPLLEELVCCRVIALHPRFPYEKFQVSCPQLKILALEDVEFFLYSSDSTPGFPNLESFTYRVNYGLSLNSTVFNSILHSSVKLTSLDVRGNSSLNSDAFFMIRSDNLDTLYLSRTNVNEYTLCYMMSKWKHSLKNLDLSHWKDESAVNCAFEELLSGEKPNLNLEVLNLVSSSISTKSIKKMLNKCVNLSYLNIESCRNLQRGIKRIYHNIDEINELREKLKVDYMGDNKKRKVC